MQWETHRDVTTNMDLKQQKRNRYNPAIRLNLMEILMATADAQFKRTPLPINDYDNKPRDAIRIQQKQETADLRLFLQIYS